MRGCRALVVVALGAIAAFGLAAQNRQAVLPDGSEEMRLLCDIYDELGWSPLSLAGPFTVDEATSMLSRVDPSRLSAAGRRAWDWLQAQLAPRGVVPEQAAAQGGPGFLLEAYPALNAEFYLHTDPSLTCWPYGYTERQPLVALPLAFWAGSSVFAEADVDVHVVHDAIEGIAGAPPDPPTWSSMPADGRYIDWEQPTSGFLSVGGNGWNFMIGRDRFAWGGAWSGDLAVSDAADYQEFARLTGYWHSFQYTAMLIGLDWEGNTAGYWPPPTSPVPDPVYPRNFFLHRFDWSPAPWISIAVNEGTMKGGNWPDLRYLNPLAVFHDFFHWGDASALLSVEARVTPFRFVTVYGQLALNAFNSPFEGLYYPGAVKTIPDAFAWLAGAETAIPIGEGYLEAGSEVAYVSPWMYIRETLLTSYSWDRYQTSNVPGSDQWVIRPLGYPLGPDSIGVSAWAGWRLAGSFRASMDLRLQWKGQNDLPMTLVEGVEAAALRTPSGANPQRRAILGLHGQGDVLPWLGVGADLYGVWTANAEHVAGNSTVDLQAVLRASVHVPRTY